MNVILETDETGTLHLPASLLPHPGARRPYRVVAEGGHLVVDEVSAATLEASITNVTKAVPKTLPIIKARLAVPADVSKLGTQEFCNFIKEEV